LTHGVVIWSLTSLFSTNVGNEIHRAYDVERGLRQMAAKYFEHTLANQSVVERLTWLSSNSWTGNTAILVHTLAVFTVLHYFL